MSILFSQQEVLSHMARFEGCPDGGPCPASGKDCVGAGVVGLLLGDQIMVTERFCSKLYPEVRLPELLEGVAKRGGCRELAYDAEMRGLGTVTLWAVSPNEWVPTTLGLYPKAESPQPPSSGDPRTTPS
jgi:hypothetical protein